jgi:hypothetical protein
VRGPVDRPLGLWDSLPPPSRTIEGAIRVPHSERPPLSRQVGTLAAVDRDDPSDLGIRRCDEMFIGSFGFSQLADKLCRQPIERHGS